jgi:hypothetical protein
MQATHDSFITHATLFCPRKQTFSHDPNAPYKRSATLKTKTFSHSLLTCGSYVPNPTGDPLRFANITTTGERCESAKGM